MLTVEGSLASRDAVGGTAPGARRRAAGRARAASPSRSAGRRGPGRPSAARSARYGCAGRRLPAPRAAGCRRRHPAGVTVRLTEVEAYDGVATRRRTPSAGRTRAQRGDVRPAGPSLRLLHLRHALVRQHCAGPTARRPPSCCGPARSSRASTSRSSGGALPGGRRTSRAAPRGWPRCSGWGERTSGVDVTDPASPVRVVAGASRGPRGGAHGPPRGRGGGTRERPGAFWLTGSPAVGPYRPGPPGAPAGGGGSVL